MSKKLCIHLYSLLYIDNFVLLLSQRPPRRYPRSSPFHCIRDLILRYKQRTITLIFVINIHEICLSLINIQLRNP